MQEHWGHILIGFLYLILCSSFGAFNMAHTADISKILYPKNVPKIPKNMSNFVTIF